MKYIVFTLTVAVAVIVMFFAFNTKSKSYAVINGHSFDIEMAITDSQKSKGLAKYEKIPESFGMLFLFGKADYYSFWMKNMKFPIDILWIDSTGKIVHIEKNLQPCVFLLPCPSYSPHDDSLYVLEVISNFTNKFDINIGDQIYSNVIQHTKG